MNVLLIGSGGSFLDSIITRLHKEGHRVSVLTGERDRKKRNKYVFEYYRFDVDSDSVPQVFESVRPEVTLYLGAFDSAAQMNSDAEAVRYFTGMMNLLVAFSKLGKGRFVYLSSSAVFEKGKAGLISEEDKPTCTSPWALVLAQAEEICDSYRRNMNLDIVTLRLDLLYCIPRSRREVSDAVSRICLQAVESAAVTFDSDDTFSMLYADDAVEFIHRVMFCSTHRESLYNISSSEEVTQEQVVQFIADTGLVLTSREQTPGTGRRQVLSNRRFNEEFGMRFFSNPRQMVELTLRKMLDEPEKFRAEKPQQKSILYRTQDRLGWLMTILLPYVENLTCFVPSFLLNKRAVGSRYTDRLDYCHLKDKLVDQKAESTEKQDYLNNRIAEISDINKSNVHVKDSQQTQNINQNNSIGKVYEVTSSLDQCMPEEVLFHAAQIMAKLMDTKDVAVYTISNETYARLFSSTSHKAQCMGRSIRYRETGELFAALQKKEVFINRKLNRDLPMMANAIYEGDEIQIIVMVWGMPREAMTLGQANLMRVASALIQDAMLRANRYMAALESQRFNPDTMILNEEAFRGLLHAFGEAKECGLTECTLLRYRAENAAGRAGEIRKILRRSDYLGELGDGSLYMLLTNAAAEDAKYAIGRLESKGFHVEIVEAQEV